MALETAHCIAPSTKKVIIEQRNSCVNGIHEPLVNIQHIIICYKR